MLLTYKQTTIFFSLLVFALICVIPLVSAGAGIVAPSIEQRTFYFSPGEEYSWTWHIHRSEILYTSLGGSLAQYATLDDPQQGSGERDVTFSLDLPQELTPGQHELWLWVEEGSSGGSGVSAKAKVGARVIFIVLYQEPYLQASLDVDSIGLGESAQAVLTLTSWSYQTLPISANINVFDPEGNSVLNVDSDIIFLDPKEKTSVTVPLDTTHLLQGTYSVLANIYGGQPNVTLSDGFRIGSADFVLKDYAKQLSTENINKFEFTVNSHWNEPAEDLYAEVRLGTVVEKTSPITIEPFDEGRFKTYLDLRSYTEEELLEGSILLYHSQGEKQFPIEVALVAEEIETVVEEKPASILSNHLLYLYALIFLLVLLNLFLLFKKNKNST